MNDLFKHMNGHELEDYAQTGVTPDWFQNALGVTTGGSQERIYRGPLWSLTVV
jgi:hypothetical protein